MIARDAAPTAPKQAGRLQFERYILDFDRGCLMLDESEVILRPKTFAVLCHLVDNHARLVSKDELFGAVWPDLAVTDDTLVQSIGELRRAFGPDGPRLIKTIPRRGYRFESSVAPVSAADHAMIETSSSSDASAAAPQPAGGITIPTPSPRVIATANVGTRIGWPALMAFAVLLSTGALAGGIWATWKDPNMSTAIGQAMTGGAAVGTKPAIAILPFVNQSDDPARDYFADGLTQDIIGALGRFSELTVMSWNAVLPYKGKPASPGDVARGLSVRYELEGSVRQTGDRVRVSAQLVDVEGRVLWSARFDEAIADVFVLQDKITTQIAGALAIQVKDVEQRRAFARPTENLEAYDYVLRTRPALQRPTRANNVEARRLLRHAIELDPRYSAAYAALAETYHIDVSMGWAEAPADGLSRAEEMANKALSIDDSEVRAHTILGRIHIFRQRYEQAMAEMDRAIAINANDANGLAGRGNILMWMGQTDAAIKALEAAQRIDPEMNSIDRFALSLAYYSIGRYDAAIEQAEINLRGTAAANFTRVVLVAAYAQNNRTEEVARVVSTIHRMDPAFDPQTFGSKFLKAADLAHLRDGLRRAGLYDETGQPSTVKVQ